MQEPGPPLHLLPRVPRQDETISGNFPAPLRGQVRHGEDLSGYGSFAARVTPTFGTGLGACGHQSFSLLTDYTFNLSTYTRVPIALDETNIVSFYL